MQSWIERMTLATRSCAVAGSAIALGLAQIGAAQAADAPTAEEQAEALKNVPEEARQYYGGYWYTTDLVSNPLENFQPNPTPWQICHNDSYLGNSWRANLVKELEMLTQQLVDQGLAEGELIVTNSNGDINLELTQLKSQIAQGCDLIMMYPGSATGLCSGIKEAFDKGILVVTIDAPVSCPEALNVATNPYFRGQYEAEWIAEQLDGKGNVVLMHGQPGTSNTQAQELGFKEVMEKFPDITLLGDLYGMWTSSVAKTEMLKFLATHPQPVDAVFSTGNMGVGVGQALEQSGRPLSIITEVTNLCSFLAYWKEKDLVANTSVQDGGPMAYAAFIPALHAMAGQKPVVNTIFMPLPVITSENFDDYYEPSMTVESTCFANGKDLHLVPNEYFAQFFTGGEPRPEVEIVATE